MSIYFHYEGTPPHTERFDQLNATVQDALTQFAFKYSQTHSSTTLFKPFKIEQWGLAPYGTKNPIHNGERLSGLVSQGEDFVVIPIEVKKPTPPPAPSAALVSAVPTAPPPSGDTTNIPVVEVIKIAEKWIQERHYARAIALYEQLLLGIAKGDRTGGHIMAKIGTIYELAGNYSKSAEYFERAVVVAEECGVPCDDVRLFAIKQYVEMKQYPKALEALAKVQGEGKKTKEFFLYSAKSNYYTGNRQTGVEMISHLLKNDDRYIEGLQFYVQVYIDEKLYQDALTVSIRLLIANSQDRKMKEFFARMFIQIPKGLEVLRQCLQPDPTSDVKGIAQGVGFIACILKDNSELPAALDLYKWCVETLDPDQPSYFLNYFHSYEVDVLYDEALQAAERYLERHRTEGVFDVTCGDVLSAMRGTVTKKSADSYPVTAYNDAQLNWLAIFFTIVKVSFIKGKIDIVFALFDTLKGLTIGQDLHKTPIRNETAYFTCIGDLLKFPFAQPLPDVQSFYFCGDSHSLCPSWRTIHGGKIQFRNSLVTGLKCWHLRENSIFYPKRNFWKVVGSIPKGSKVIMLFGEIDCREGIVRAVELGRYKDVEEGMIAAINIYISALKQLRDEHQFDLWIHPPLPLIECTRHLVFQFNQILKRLLLASGFRYMDFLPELCEGEGKGMKIKKEYELDGVHINPLYLSVLEKHIEIS